MDLWTQASRDIQAEAHLRTMTAIRVEGSSIWPFLALARSEGEFAHRLALVADRVDRAVATVIPPEDPQFLPAKDQYLASLRHDFGIHLEAQRKQAVETAQCVRCGKTITHGGSKALSGADQWFDSDDNFMCPDGEEEHRPGSSKESASNKLPPEFLENIKHKDGSDDDSTAKESSFRVESVLIPGHQLTPDQREKVKSAFIYRWTKDNQHRLRAYKPCPSCDIKNPAVNTESAAGHNHPTIPLSTDDEWLASHSFHFTKGGELHAGRRYAEPYYGDSKEGSIRQSSFNEEAFKTGMRMAEVAASSARAINTGLVVKAGEGQSFPQEFLDGIDAYFRRNAFRKGAPFGGYEDFDACVKANSDKDDPSAYCGKIKHETEDNKESVLRATAEEHGGYHIEEDGGKYKVVNHIGETKSIFDSREEALNYQRALMVNVPGAAESAERHEENDDKAKHSSLRTEALDYEPGLGCPHCNWAGYTLSDRAAHIEREHEGQSTALSPEDQFVVDRVHQGAYNPFTDPESAYNNPDKGPHKGTPDDLFPNGVPLHGDLSPEQEAWLKRRGSRLDPKEGKDAPQRALPRRPGEVKTHMMRDHGFAENAEFHEVKHERLHMANPWGVSGHGAKPHWHSEYDPTKRGSLDSRSAAAPFPLHRRESDEPERKPDVLWYESEPEKEVEPWPSARQGSFVRLSEIPSHSSVTCTYCNQPIGGSDRVVETPHGPRHAEHAHMGSLQVEAIAWGRRHYESLASAISNFSESDKAAEHFAGHLEGTNPAYRREQFHAAASTKGGYKPRGGTGQPNFTSGHFRHIAEGIKSYPGDRKGLAEHLANHLATTNPRFNRDTFLKASTGALRIEAIEGPGYCPACGSDRVIMSTAYPPSDMGKSWYQNIGTGECKDCGTKFEWTGGSAADGGQYQRVRQGSLHTAAGPHRPIHEIAREINREWGKQKGGVNFAAKPYLEAMHSLKDTHDNYGADSGHGIVSYFMGNASQYRGETAKAHKAELKAHLKERPRLGEPTTASLQTFAIFDAEGSLIDTDEDQGRANALAHLVRGSVRPFSEATEDQPGTAGLQSRTADMYPHLHADCEFGDGPIEFQLPGGWIHSDTFAPQCSGSVSGEGYNTVATPKPDTVRQASLSAEAEAFTRYELQEQRYDAEDSYELGYADGVQGKPSNSHMFRDWGTTNYPADLSSQYEHGYLDGMMARSPGEIHDPGPGQSVHESPGRQPVHVPRMAPAPGIERERARERELVYATKHIANPYDPDNNPYLQHGRDQGSSMPDMAGNTPVTTRPRQIPRGPSTTPPPEPGGMDLDPGDTDPTSEREDM